jgi:small subunit ribosomal protein S16
MVKLRLTRLGKTHAPFYRIVAIDSRKARDGKCLEVIGNYDPTKSPKQVNIDADRAKYWLSVGAIPTDTVRYLLTTFAGIELPKKAYKEPKKAVATEKAEG